MINRKVEKALNERINAEMYSSYLSMASDLEGISPRGFAHWMKSQAQEELFHAMKFEEFYEVLK